MKAKEAAEQFFNSITDLTSLEVLTYTGQLEQVVDKETGQIDWEAFKPTQGELVLALATRVRPNFHTVNYRAEKLDPADMEALSKLHFAAVESAQNGRNALAKMMMSLVGVNVGEDEG